MNVFISCRYMSVEYVWYHHVWLYHFCYGFEIYWWLSVKIHVYKVVAERIFIFWSSFANYWWCFNIIQNIRDKQWAILWYLKMDCKNDFTYHLSVYEHTLLMRSAWLRLPTSNLNIIHHIYIFAYSGIAKISFN